MVTISPTHQIFHQHEHYQSINNESEYVTMDFRAPPPSPIGSSRRSSSVANDDVFSEFLETSLRVPDLILPDKIFPRQKPLGGIPTVNFQALIKGSSTGDLEALKVKESLAEFGCFQVIDHGISRKMIETVERKAARIFRLAPEKKRLAARSMEVPYGFEEVSGDQEEVVGELGEEFVWSESCGLKSKMEGIWPIKYSKFCKKMEHLASAIEKVSESIMSIVTNERSCNGSSDDHESLIGETHRKSNGSKCHIYKHPQGVSSDQCISWLRYEVIRMMVRGSDHSHGLSLHLCDGSTEFHVYSKKSWAYFTPLHNALVVTTGDRLQARSGGRYKHVIGKPIFASKNKDRISMAFLHNSAPSTSMNCAQQVEKVRLISLQDQALFAILLIIACQVLLHIQCLFRHS